MAEDAGQSVKTRAERAVLAATYKKSVDATQTFEEILGVALPATVRAITINNPAANVLYINPAGTALATHGGIVGQSFTIWGDKAALDAYELLTGVATDIHFFVYTIVDGV